jgi:DNA polymerase III delta prime subunit
MSDNKIANALWTETLRPKSLNQCILLPRVKSELEKGLIDNILLCGTPGLGKTTIARILCKQAKGDVLELNGSLENGIDIIRQRVEMFATSASLFGGGFDDLKVVFFDESDGLTKEAQKALRPLLESTWKSCRYIWTCNYLEKIIEPIQSRFNVISLNPINSSEEQYLIEQYTIRVKQILDAVKISYTEDNVKTFVLNNYPDMRKIVKKLQQLYTRGCTELTSDMLNSSFDCSSLYQLICSAPDPWNNYKMLVSEWANKSDDGIIQIGKEFPEYIHTAMPQKDSKIPQILVTCAEHQSMLVNAIDKFVVFESLIFKLQMIVNS